MFNACYGQKNLVVRCRALHIGEGLLCKETETARRLPHLAFWTLQVGEHLEEQ